MPENLRFLMIKRTDLPKGHALPEGCWTVIADTEIPPRQWVWHRLHAPAPQGSDDESRQWVAIPKSQSRSLQGLPHEWASCVVDAEGIPLAGVFFASTAT
jgi:hypothetical protein